MVNRSQRPPEFVYSSSQISSNFFNLVFRANLAERIWIRKHASSQRKPSKDSWNTTAEYMFYFIEFISKYCKRYGKMKMKTVDNVFMIQKNIRLTRVASCVRNEANRSNRIQFSIYHRHLRFNENGNKNQKKVECVLGRYHFAKSNCMELWTWTETRGFALRFCPVSKKCAVKHQQAQPEPPRQGELLREPSNVVMQISNGRSSEQQFCSALRRSTRDGGEDEALLREVHVQSIECCWVLADEGRVIFAPQ